MIARVALSFGGTRGWGGRGCFFSYSDILRRRSNLIYASLSSRYKKVWEKEVVDNASATGRQDTPLKSTRWMGRFGARETQRMRISNQ